MDESGRELSQDADRDDDGDAVADPALRDLVTHPHEEEGAGGHDKDGEEAEGESGIGNQRDAQLGDGVNDAGEEGVGLGALEGEGQEPSLENAEGDRCVAGVLGDLLATTILAGKAPEAGNHGPEELEHDRGADVGHDAQGEDGAIPQRAAGEEVEEGGHAAADLGVGDIEEPLTQHLGVDARGGDGGADPHDDDHAEGEEDALPQLGDLEDVGECRNHAFFRCRWPVPLLRWSRGASHG